MLAFIDGSNVELITTPALCVGMIRVAYAAFDGKKRIAGNMREHFVIIEAHGASKYHALLFPKIGSHDQFVIDAEDPDLREGKSRVVLSKGITLARDLAEIHLIVELGKVYPEWTYVRDGDLQAKHPLIQEVLERVYAEKISVAALAKTSDLLTDQGESLLDSVHERAPSGAWMYAPVNDTAPENHQAVIAVVNLRADKKAADRYPETLRRLERLLQTSERESLEESMRHFLEQVALSNSADEIDLEGHRVNLLTLHATKGLEFSRVSLRAHPRASACAHFAQGRRIYEAEAVRSSSAAAESGKGKGRTRRPRPARIMSFLANSDKALYSRLV